MHTTPAAEARPPKQRSRWWRLHAWLGLKLSLFLTVIFLSGTLAVLGNEIDWLADPAMRASPAAGEEASWGTIASSALRAVPGGHIDLIERGPDRWFATVVVMQAPDGHRRRVLVDPASGRVQRVAGFGGAQRFLRDFHRRFMLPVAIGLPLVTSFAFVMLVSLVTGLVSYKKFWRGFLRTPRWRDLRTASGDLHRLAGLWSLWFIALIIATSLWYLVELFGGAAPVLLPLDRAAKGAPPPALAQPVGPELDRLAATARAAYPGLDIRRVQYPFPGVTAVGFQGEARSLLTTEKANAVWVDPASGRPVKRFVGERLSAHQRLSEMADPIHFGSWGGLASKLLWFLFGALLTGLSITGVIIYATRLKGAWVTAARGLSGWGLAAIALVAVALWLTPVILLG
jgi:uncharacterized iron-regulated membrane protein